ncbi:ABC transporter substrate-binding protein [Desertihabitans aurantiacus]|uniref:ABC transporter substrate-binding protein n=1 Tax=Desertihabitans aurantiacus TaxID=2282477 RepID=UPI000DF86249|nr:ABC transporter substrate-binding protein [Desertihabitans aurantiacus]
MRIRLALPVLIAGLVVAGCTPTASQVDGPSEQQGAGALVVGVTSDPDTLLPWTATQFQAVNVLQNVYGTLTEFDSDLEVVPGLAESWETSEDGTTLTLTLREGVTFHDGSTFDSEDVVHSLEAIQAEETAAVARTSLASVTGITAVDPSTVELSLSTPDAGLPSNLASINMAILSSQDETSALETAPNGTGPFTFTDRTPSQSLSLQRFDGYWGEAALVEGVEFRVIPDETSILAAMQSGNVQLSVLDDPLVAQSAGAGITIERTPQLSYHALQLNTRRGALTDQNVRLAMQCAIDRQVVLDTAALGEGEVTGPITSPAYRSDPADRPCPTRDLDRAREYLAAAGEADGVTITAIVSQGEYATSVNEAQALQAQLAEADITLELETLESGAYVDRWVAADFEAAVALNGGRPDPDGMYGRYFTSEGNLNEVAGYSSPRLDELFAMGRAETDENARREIYAEISGELEAQAAWIWLFTGYTYTATTEGVSGFVPLANGSLQNLRLVSVS